MSDFKETEIGNIPIHWKVNTIGQIGDVSKLAGFEYTKHFSYVVDGEVIALRALMLEKEFLIYLISKEFIKVFPMNCHAQNYSLMTFFLHMLVQTLVNLRFIANDIVIHFSLRQEVLDGKAMIVTMSRRFTPST